MKCKVFSATMAKEREILGERVTDFIKQHVQEVLSTEVRQSSDEAFHCLTIVLWYK